MPRSEKSEAHQPTENVAIERGDVSDILPTTLSGARIYKEWKTEVPAQFRRIVESAMIGKTHEYKPTGLPKVDGFLSALQDAMGKGSSDHGDVSVDLPLVAKWEPKEKVGLYRAVMRAATNSTPDHAGLMAIEQTIMAQREAWKNKTHRSEEKPPLEFVVTTLDGGSDDPSRGSRRSRQDARKRNSGFRLRHDRGRKTD